MKIKLLTTALCSSALLLTACGGGSSNSENNSDTEIGNNTITSNVDYSKAETSDLMTYPVVSLTKAMDNSLLYIGNIASEIHADTIATDVQTSCESGTVQKNSNGTVTLNNCKNFKINGSIYEDVAGLTLSGTVNSVETDTKSASISTEKYDISLTNLTVKYDDGEVETYNGKMLQTFTYNETTQETKYQYDIDKIEASFTDKTDKERYILTNYRLTETSNQSSSNTTPAIATGTLQGDVNGQKFSVKFDSDIKYSWGEFAPSQANINIEDTNNSKNTITIKNTTDGKALISAFANGTSVTGYPKTINWYEFD